MFAKYPVDRIEFYYFRHNHLVFSLRCRGKEGRLICEQKAIEKKSNLDNVSALLDQIHHASSGTSCFLIQIIPRDLSARSFHREGTDFPKMVKLKAPGRGLLRVGLQKYATNAMKTFSFIDFRLKWLSSDAAL